MKRHLAILALAVIALGLPGALPRPGLAQGPSSAAAGDLRDKVSSIVDRFPGDTAAATAALASEILKLGPEAVVETFARVQPPGAGDDAKARFAVNALAVHVTRPGAETERRLFVKALHAALSGNPDKNVAAFFITQVELAGKTESIKPLAKHLADQKLACPAAAALQTIGGPEAAKALLKAFDRAPRSARVSIVNALGRLRSRESVRTLLALAEADDEDLRRASRSALANIGDPAAGPALAKVRVDASLAERAEAPRLYLLHARRLAESGRTSAATKAARRIMDSYTRPSESALASDALSLIVSILGVKAVPDLLDAVGSPSAAVRGAALELATGLGLEDVTARWTRTAAASGPEVRAAIVEMLGRRGDSSALAYVRECLHDGDRIVRLAAIPASAKLGGETVLTDFFGLLSTSDADEAAALRTRLLMFKAGDVVPEAAGRIAATPAPGKAVLIDILGEKGARGEIGRVFALAADADPSIRAAAAAALAKLAGEGDIPDLVGLLEKATDADDIVNLQNAVTAAAQTNPDQARRGAPLVDLLKAAGPARKAVILRALPKVGGTKGLAAAVAEAANADSQVRTAAIYALSQWPDDAAADELLRIATTTADKKHRLLAVEGYVRLVGRGDLTGQRKLVLFGDLMAKPFDDADKKQVLTAAAEVREPEALRLLAAYLDHQVLGDTAAAGLLDLASEQAPAERWLSGHEAYSVLRRVEASLADPVERDRAAKVIQERLRQGGYVPLFDGRTLEGWKGLVADPPSRAKMTPQELAKAQAEADERMRAHWQAVDGALVFDGRGESLCAVKDYADFELLADWKIEKGGDSGLYLRGSPQVQIWDAAANPVGSGGLYNNQKGRSVPSEKADRPAGEWNSFRIIMIGERVSVYLNDKLVVDNTALENYWERDKPIYPSGQIELQAHGNPLYFRNIFIREIPPDAVVPEPDPAEAAEGFEPLFNGRDLAGWTGGGGGYAAEDGKIVVHPERGGGNLYTEKEFSDFVLRFEFKLTPAANNGLGVRAPLEGDAAYAGMELQILEDGSPVYWALKPTQYHGSVYGVVPAKRGVLRPVGEWNTEEVTVQGRRVKVEVNGNVIVDADLDAAAAGGTVDGREHPGLARTSGHIGFLGHGSIVEFRRIRVKELR